MNDEIESFFDKYSSEFKSNQNNRLLGCFDFPVMICHSGKSTVYFEHAQLDADLNVLKNIYRSKNLEKFNFKITQFVKLSDAHVLVGVEWTYKNFLGEVKNNFVSYYNLIKKENQFYIQMVTNPNERL